MAMQYGTKTGSSGDGDVIGKTKEAADVMAEKSREVADAVVHRVEGVSESIREKPLQSVAIAFIAGALFAKIFWR